MFALLISECEKSILSAMIDLAQISSEFEVSYGLASCAKLSAAGLS